MLFAIFIHCLCHWYLCLCGDEQP